MSREAGAIHVQLYWSAIARGSKSCPQTVRDFKLIHLKWDFMTGILLLILAGIWLTFAFWISKKATSVITRMAWRVPITLLAFAALLPLPLIDEIVGAKQFSKLCNSNAAKVHMQNVAGRSVYNDLSGFEVPVPGTWVKVWRMTSRFRDQETGEVLLSFDQFRAEGGHLVPSFDSGHEPLTFKGTCAPPKVGSMSLFSDLGLNLIKKPKS